MRLGSNPLRWRAVATVPAPSSARRQIKVFAHSYNEVLLFLKHQDDKINRVLTALAFLTTAGVTLYIFGRTKAPADFPRFYNASLRADDYFFFCFLVGLFLALSFALVALDPTSFMPRFLRAHGSESILFYQAIATLGRTGWDSILNDPDIESRLASSFHGDALRLSHRAVHKVRRFSAASAFVQFTVVTLALLGIVRVNHFSVDTRWWLVSGTIIVYSAFPTIDFLYFRTADFPDVGPDYVDENGAGRVLLEAAGFYLPVFVMSTVGLLAAHGEWQPITAAFGGTLAIRIISVSHRTPLSLGVAWGATIAGTVLMLGSL